MTTPVEQFTIELSRVSAQGNKFLRGLTRTQRDDAVAGALLWCWENREKFDTSRGALQVWWTGALRNAIQQVRRDVARHEGRRVYKALEELERVSRGASGGYIEPSDNARKGKAPIDHEIERILRRPKHERADCPSCWRCRWYDGLTPAAWRRTLCADKELEDAIYNVERRKIEIAGRDIEEYET